MSKGVNISLHFMTSQKAFNFVATTLNIGLHRVKSLFNSQKRFVL